MAINDSLIATHEDYRVISFKAGHSDVVSTIAFSRDSARLVSGSLDLSAVVWSCGLCWSRLCHSSAGVSFVCYILNLTEIETIAKVAMMGHVYAENLYVDGSKARDVSE